MIQSLNGKGSKNKEKYYPSVFVVKWNFSGVIGIYSAFIILNCLPDFLSLKKVSG
jgi:hypothetical protein